VEIGVQVGMSSLLMQSVGATENHIQFTTIPTFWIHGTDTLLGHSSMIGIGRRRITQAIITATPITAA
jgi:hypothetical protein